MKILIALMFLAQSTFADTITDLLSGNTPIDYAAVIQLFPLQGKCRATAEKFPAAFSAYEDAVGNGKNLLVPGRLQAIRDILSEATSACYESIRTVYLALSLKLLTFGPKDARPGKIYLFRVALASLLSYRNTFLTDDLRWQFKGRWLEDGPTGRPLILGAYDCAQTQIYLEPDLPPYDLAAAYVHELDHLFRDKWPLGPDSADDKVTALWSNPRDSVSTDEFFASIHAAYLEHDLLRSISFVDRGPHLIYPWLYPAMLVHPFNPGIDITFYRHGGNLDKIWKILADRFQTEYTPGTMLTEFFSGHSLAVPQIENARAYAPEVFNTIARVYFAAMANQVHESDPLNPLANLVLAQTQTIHAETIPKVVELFAKPTKSLSCEIFENAVHEHKLDDYLGSDPDGPGPIHPGSEGVRPIKPDLPKKPKPKKASSVRDLKKLLEIPRKPPPETMRPCLDTYDRL